MSEPVHTPNYSPHITRPIDNTALSSYNECPRKFYYGMVLHRRKVGAEKPALVYGTVWHKMLETHYKTGGQRELVEAAAQMSWKDHENPDDHRTLSRVIRAYDGYLKKYGNVDEEANGWGSTVGYPEQPAVEISSEVSWDGALHPYTVKIDRIFQHQGLFYVEDHKTTSQMGVHYFKQFDPSAQMMGYAWIAQLITGLPIAGVRINAHAVLKTQDKFERQTIPFSPDRLREWAANYNVQVKRLEQSYKLLEGVDEPTPEQLLEAFPHNYAACAAKYGQCAYTEICTTPVHIRRRVLELDFVEEAWNPLEVDEGE